MAEIKPAEVSAILRQQLAGFQTEAELEEIGSVLQVGDGIARIEQNWELELIALGISADFLDRILAVRVDADKRHAPCRQALG